MLDRDDERVRWTERLRLEPVGPANAADLWAVQADESVWPWYGPRRPTRDEVRRSAAEMGAAWRTHGVHKWIAYDRVSGAVVGRGGLSRTPIDDDWGQLYAFLPDRPWVRAVHRPGAADPSGTAAEPLVHADWVELGWALRGAFWGQGLAAEIGRAGLRFGFDVLGVQAVVSCTARHNTRSRAVMERIGLRYAGEIRTRGLVEGCAQERDDAPYGVSVLLRTD